MTSQSERPLPLLCEEDGLLRHYDAVILGTGVVESILATALAQSGRSVLHLDKNDYYGGATASFQLLQLSEWAQLNMAGVPSEIDGDASTRCDVETATQTLQAARRAVAHARTSKAAEEAEEGDQPEEAKEEVTETDQDRAASTKEIGNLKLVNLHPLGKYPAVEVMHVDSVQTRRESVPSHPAFAGYDASSGGEQQQGFEAAADATSVHPAFAGYDSEACKAVHPNLEDCVKQNRRFSIDLSNRIVLSNGTMVEAMVNSNVARYLEFKSIDKLFYTHIEATGDASNPLELRTVPCSKQEVFKSNLLTALEKRVLMKFLQFASDWGRLEQGTEVTTLNENELAQGRSLNRPQNKQVSDYTIAGFEQRPFVDFLTHYKIPDRLQHLIIYGLALWPYPDGDQQQLLTEDGLRAVARHANSLGRFGTTAFLAPLYGAGEIPQSYCRMCAVSGGTYILRRSVVQLIVDEENRVRGIVDSTGRVTSCDIFACSPEYLPDEFAQSKRELLYTRVAIVDRAVLSETDRGVAIIPPKTLAVGNPNALHVIQLDGGLYVCPEDVRLVYVTTTAPEGTNPSEMLDTAMRLLCERAGARELWHMLSRQRLIEAVSSENVQLPGNLCICGEHDQQLYFHDAVAQARKLFEQVCPGAPFLPPKEIDVGEVDEETEYLQSIVQSYVPNPATNQTTPTEEVVEPEASSSQCCSNPDTAESSGITY